jgi:hypothetical protein
MSAIVDMGEVMKNKLRMHLDQSQRRLFPVSIGDLVQLQTALKITHSEDIASAIRKGTTNYYPVLSERQYLVACVKEESNVRVWGIYNADQILQMKALHDGANIEWKLLVIPEELENELRGVTPAYSNPQQPRRTCALM